MSWPNPNKQKKKLLLTEDDIKVKVVKSTLKKMGSWQFMPVSSGMGKHGIPDHVACVPITITPEMVGKRVGIFVAIESKRPTKCNDWTPQQGTQMQQIDEAGGITGVVCNEFSMIHIVKRIVDLTKGIWNDVRTGF